MSFKYFYRDNDGTITELTSRVRVGGLRSDKVDDPGTDGMVMNAEEGTAGVSALTVDDPAGTFVINGHRLVYIEETLCAGDAYGGRVWAGYCNIREISRESETMGGLGRAVHLNVDDINSILDRRIQFGAENKRPAETDVERITWLMTTNEAALIDDYTYFSTDDPVDMDDADYRNQSFRQILDDCAQQSGKNWYLWMSADGYSLWYAPRDSTDFSSDLRISNDPGEIDSTDTFAPAGTTRFKRDPTRVYSGINVAYNGGNTYIQDDTIASAFARRDKTSPALNVKTVAKAKARGQRMLRDNATEEDTITTAIQVPRADANRVVAGQRLEVLFTHLAPEGYGDWVWMRCVNKTIREISLAKVELALELLGDAPTQASGAAAYGILTGSGGPYDTENGSNLVHWANPGDTPGPGFPLRPTVGDLTVLTDGSPPKINRTHWGWQIDGTGTIDVTAFLTVYGILKEGIDYTWTMAICVNGTPADSVDIAVSAPVGSNLYSQGWDPTLSIAALAVSNGDEITVTLETSPARPFFWRTPRGSGQNGERLEITDGTLA